MKTLKKVSSALFACVLAVYLLAAPSTAFAQEGTYVFDEGSLFSSSEFSELESQAAGLAEKYNMGVYFLTTDYMDGMSDPTSSQRTSYASSFYRSHELGLNKGGSTIGDGVMFVVASQSRDYVTIAYGQGSYSFSDDGIEAIEDAAVDKLHGDDWYGAAKEFYDGVGKQLDYYDRNGSAFVPLDMFDWAIRIALVLVVPALIAYVVVNGWRKEMLTAQEKSTASEYLDITTLNVTRSSDQFVNTTLVATPKPKDNDSGGGWGGGGDGGFSSSGGGKF